MQKPSTVGDFCKYYHNLGQKTKAQLKFAAQDNFVAWHGRSVAQHGFAAQHIT